MDFQESEAKRLSAVSRYPEVFCMRCGGSNKVLPLPHEYISTCMSPPTIKSFCCGECAQKYRDECRKNNKKGSMG